MERMDVMERNVAIFASQGKALQCAKAGVKCLVVGNPANTNAAILSEHAPQVPKANISALTRLDHNRARVSPPLICPALEPTARTNSRTRYLGDHLGDPL